MSLFSSIPIVGDIIDTVVDSGLVDNVPVLGTAAKVISGINTRQEQRDATNRAYEFNSEEAQKQRDWEENMWSKNNLYNSPANQLKLMQEAGLNPNTFQTSISPASMPSGGASASSPSSVPQTPSQSGLASALQSLELKGLQEDIKSKVLSNRDKENEVRAKESNYMDGVYIVDSKGNPQFIPFQGNSYDFDVQKKINEIRSMIQKQEIDYYTMGEAQVMRDVAQSSRDVLKQMNVEKLRELQEDIRSKSLNNTLLSDEVEMQHKYGISSKDSNVFTALLRAAVTDPDNVNRLLDALINAASKTGEHIGDILDGFISRLSSNPLSSSINLTGISGQVARAAAKRMRK